jgi:multiple sugar transport system ATP-binding protein
VSENLVLKNLYKRYDNTDKKKKKAALNPYAVSGLNLDMKQGAFISILGPSGCGKSTTLRMIAGLESITEGQILIGDSDISKLHPKDRDIGLAFEDYALYPPLTVYENIAFCLRARKTENEEIDRRVREIAKTMKVEELLDSRVSGLSGGQKQRVNIARALVRRPKVLLLDEPLSHLDGKMRQVLRGEIKRLHNEIKCTTILVTHDQIEAISLADYIAIMNFGVLQQYGTPEEIYNDPANEFVAGFIGEPPMNLLKVRVVEKEPNRYDFELENGSLVRVPRRFYSAVRVGETYDMGVRPTSIEIVDSGDYDAEFRVDLFEFLGEERSVGVQIKDSLLNIVYNDRRRFAEGQMIRVRINHDLLYLFDPETGNRIRPESVKNQ